MISPLDKLYLVKVIRKLSTILIFLLLIPYYLLLNVPHALAVYCDPPITGPWTITSACVLYGASDGTATGDITINAGTTLTIYSGKNLVWYPGQAIHIPTGASIIIQNGSQIIQRKICYKDSGLANNVAASGYAVAATGKDPRTNADIYLGLDQVAADPAGNCPTYYRLRDLLASKDFVDMGTGVAGSGLATAYRYLLNLGMAISGINNGQVEVNAVGNTISILGDNFKVCKGAGGCNNSPSTLTTYGNLTIEGYATASALAVGYGSFVPATNGEAYINSKLGIGTTSPGATLNVVGPNAASGNAIDALTVVAGKGSGGSAVGGNISLTSGAGGDGGIGGTGGDGGDIIIAGGLAGTATGSNGHSGDVFIYGGASQGVPSGTAGNVMLAIDSGGTARGNVGIGTTAPGALLEIKSPSSNGVATKLLLTDGAGGGKSWELQSGISTVSDAYFGIRNATDNVQALSITNTGNVGIGTTVPLTTLDVNGTGYFRSTANAGLTVGNGTTGYAQIGSAGWYDDGSYFSPLGSRPLYIRTTTGTSYIYSASIYLGDNSSTNNIYLRNNNLSGNNFSIPNSGNVYFTGGNVGIGTTGPNYTLDVQGQIRNRTAADASPYTQARVWVYGGTGVDGTNWGYLGYGYDAVLRLVYGKSPTGGALAIGQTSANDNTGTFTERIRVDGNGNVGIGTTSPRAKLEVLSSENVYSSGNLTSAATARQITVGEGSNNSAYRLAMGYYLEGGTAWNGVVQTTVNSGGGNLLLNPIGGYVGIGTTGPTVALDVVGNIRATGGASYMIPWQIRNGVTMGISVTYDVFAATTPTYAGNLKFFNMYVYVATTNNATNYWVVHFKNSGGSDVFTVNTSGCTVATWCLLTSTGRNDTINANNYYYLQLTKTLSPGNIDVLGPAAYVQ